MSEKKDKKEKVTLNKEELQLISQILYRNQFNGETWQKTITPLLNKLGNMINEQ